jgi:hypothetical protein
MKRRVTWAQAWVTLRADDPAAVSALAVAQRTLAAGRGLTSLARHRLFELGGALPEREALEELLHRSSQFYNPHKETCVLRRRERDPAPVPAGCHAVLVTERDATRRPAAERWWAAVTGERVEVHEGVVWVPAFAPEVDAGRAAVELALVRDRAHGLLCNPNAQDHDVAAAVPLRWIGRSPEPPAGASG